MTTTSTLKLCLILREVATNSQTAYDLTTSALGKRDKGNQDWLWLMMPGIVILIRNCTESYRLGTMLHNWWTIGGILRERFFMMCDNATKYMAKVIIYSGKGSTPVNIPQAEYLTPKLVEPIKGTNVHITCDNCSSSILLAQKCWKTMGSLWLEQ